MGKTTQTATTTSTDKTSTAVKRTRVQTPKLKDPNAPKKPKSAYICFTGARRVELAASDPDMPNKDVLRRCGADWQELTAEGRVEFEVLAADDKVRYVNEMKDYVRPSDEDLQQFVKKPRKVKKHKPEGYPKGASSSYIYFTNDVRATVVAQNPELKSKDVIRKIGEMWQKTTDRVKYDESATADRMRFAQEKLAWIAVQPVAAVSA